jgi:hypothetical protein
MLFVFVSHFGIAYFEALGNVRLASIASILALPSTPAFVVLSGLLIGFLSVRSPGSLPNLTVKLMDRGLFLLLPAHAIIVIAHLVIFGHARFVFITDAIGICILVGPWMVARFSSLARAVLGIGLMAFSWRIYLTWDPASSSGRWLHAVLFGDPPFKNGWLTFAILPWLGAYLVATPLGEALAKWRRAGQPFILRLGGVALAAIAAGAALHLLGRKASPGLHAFLSAGQKYPPSPAFVLTSGGLGLCGTASFAWIEERKLFPSLLAAVALLGRCSLVVFVLQYFVYYVVVYSLHLAWSPAWPAYLVASVAFIFGVAYWWDRHLGNEYLTVGLARLYGGRTKGAVVKS